MFIRCRLRKLLFFSKVIFICATFVFLMLVSFGLLESLFDVLSETTAYCSYKEKVDVVYTWVNGSDALFIRNLNEFIRGKNSSFDSSKQRFDDKYELKFSLRALEKFAPWVNHVYIVTNGQIPYWLNLDYEKVSVITHEEIFKDTLNLPTFSSPAIESNIHRIEGLSKRFIYFNDDVFLASPTFLEDFYSPNKGSLVYLAWPVPNCASGCPWMYVADGQCDKDCYNPKCQWDGGDCELEQAQKTDLKVSTESLEISKTSTIMLETTKDENETRNHYLAETIKKVRTNFYNTFLKKLSNGTDVKPNVTHFVNAHNRFVLEKNKRERRRRRKRRNAYNHKYPSEKPPRLIDAYSASLQHTNRMLNKAYGFKSRKVPSHAPIMIDRDVVEELQVKFAREIMVTEGNRVRRGNDVQFSFSYYYFLMLERVERSIDEVFDEFDTDLSNTWSDREIRTLLTKLYELPLSYAIVDHFEALLLNCSESGDFPDVPTPLYERYIDSKLPTISKDLIRQCSSLNKIILQRFGSVPKYKYEVVSNSESEFVSFKMLNSNISDVVSKLDDIRSDGKKFVCLNDNLDESKESENELIRAILYDFYMSLFPLPSRFELPEDYRNRFLYVDELEEWKRYQLRIKLFLYCVVSFLLYLMVYNLCKKKCCQISNKVFC